MTSPKTDSTAIPQIVGITRGYEADLQNVVFGHHYPPDLFFKKKQKRKRMNRDPKAGFLLRRERIYSLTDSSGSSGESKLVGLLIEWSVALAHSVSSDWVEWPIH